MQLASALRHHFKKEMKKSKYAILVKNKDTGDIQGVVENSFSMGRTYNYVRVWSHNDIYCSYYKSSPRDGKGIQKWIDRMTKLEPNEEVFITRIGSKNCPVDVRLDYNPKNDKYYHRNKPFTKKLKP